MKTRNLSALLITAGLLAGAPAVAADLDAEMISNTCAGCHGTDGASVGQAPVIAGMNEMYLMQTMQNYKDGLRYGTIMERIARGYDKGQIMDMSKHYANQPWVNAKQEVDSALAAKGKQLHMAKGCVGCHGANGISPMPTTPRLAGQYADYMVITMQQYQNPKVAIPPVAMPMRGMLAGMSEEDLKALAHFYASQK